MMTELSQCIVASARSHIGTRFAHQGRRKKSDQDQGGIDCLGLLVSVAHECKLMHGHRPLAACDELDYGHIPDSRRLQQALAKYLTRIPLSDMQGGDAALVCIDGNPQHMGIIADYVAGGHSLIHAYAPSRLVVEHRLDKSWKERLTALYRFLPAVT